jgi:hypothetical protein
MAKDLTVMVPNRPGMLADLSEVLGNAGISMNGVCAFPSEGKVAIHILVDNPSATRGVLDKAKLQVLLERDVLIIGVEDKPGEFGKICRKLANIGININLVYPTVQGKVVIGVDDLERAREALG